MSTLHILPKSSQSDGSLERALPLDIVASSVTPFDDDGTINFSLLKPDIDWLIAEGADGLSPLSGRRPPRRCPWNHNTSGVLGVFFRSSDTMSAIR
jgi:hypothetical protein